MAGLRRGEEARRRDEETKIRDGEVGGKLAKRRRRKVDGEVAMWVKNKSNQQKNYVPLTIRRCATRSIQVPLNTRSVPSSKHVCRQIFANT